MENVTSENSDRNRPAHSFKHGLLPPATIISVGLMLSFGAYFELQSRQRERQADAFREQAEERAEIFRLEIGAGLEALHSLRAFFMSSEEVTGYSFRSYAQAQLARHPEILGFSWSPVIPATDRAEVENGVRSEGLPDFRFTERNEQGELVPAASRDLYIPVLFLEPYKGNEAALGFDIASDADRWSAVEKARDSGSAASTARITLVQEQADQFASLVMLPVFAHGATVETPEQRRSHFKGLVVGVYRISNLVEQSLLTPPLSDDSFDVFVFDQSGAPGQRRLYPNTTNVDSADELDGSFLFSQSVSIGGREWQVVLRRSELLASGDTPWLPFVSLFVGIFITGLLAAYLRTLLVQRSRTEATVRSRTQELNETNQALLQNRLALQEAQTDLEALVEHRTDALNESQGRFQTLVESAPFCIHEIDAYGKLLSMNKAGLQMMGVEKESDVHGLDYLSIPKPDQREHVADLFRQALEGHASDFEFELESDNGPVHLNSCFVPLRDQSGKVTKVMGVTEDISERKQTEANLRQAQKTEAIGQLTGGVAHDFNNLLAVIMGNAELLADELGSNDPLTQEIIKASQRGSELTHRLLAFSRQQSLMAQPIDLDELVSGMLKILERTLGEQIEIVKRGSSELWPVLVDAGQLENAILNLALNARDAMPDGGRLTLDYRNLRLDGQDKAWKQELDPGDYVLLAVSDTGTGMSDEARERAFEPFFSTKEVGKGSGLGLSMVYGFSKQSGGHATIESTSGRGSTVKLYLPRAPHMPEGKAAKTSPSRPIGNRELILVVEDDPDVRNMVLTMLKALGYRVLVVAEAASAQAALADNADIDLVLCDVVLPGGVTGPEFAETVHLQNRDTKFVFMSGYSTEVAAEDRINRFGHAFLQKPFQRAKLAAVLREVLRM